MALDMLARDVERAQLSSDDSRTKDDTTPTRPQPVGLAFALAAAVCALALVTCTGSF